MDHSASEGTTAAGRMSQLPDASLASLAELFSSEDTVLATALRRVVSEAGRSIQAISGWSSYVDSRQVEPPEPPTE